MIYRSKSKTIYIENFTEFELNSHDHKILSKFHNIFFSPKYNEILPQLNSLLNIVKIVFGNAFNCPLYQTNLPNSLQYLQFGAEFNQLVDNLPSCLSSLHFGTSFNQTVLNLPSNLKILRFGTNFNQSVENLPCGLKILFFGRNFSQSVDNLPESLVWIKFSDRFNCTVNNLPRNLLYVEFGRQFNQSICSLPDSVKILIFPSGSKYQVFREKLPFQLGYLKLPRDYLRLINFNNVNEFVPYHVPLTLKKIVSCNLSYYQKHFEYLEKIRQICPDLKIVDIDENDKLISRYKHHEKIKQTYPNLKTINVDVDVDINVNTNDIK